MIVSLRLNSQFALITNKKHNSQNFFSWDLHDYTIYNILLIKKYMVLTFQNWSTWMRNKFLSGSWSIRIINLHLIKFPIFKILLLKAEFANLEMFDC